MKAERSGLKRHLADTRPQQSAATRLESVAVSLARSGHPLQAMRVLELARDLLTEAHARLQGLIELERRASGATP